tara:strand:- start:608 stop:817 length:210 start_codon:yes stop_codon:yes gene_type:complete
MIIWKKEERQLASSQRFLFSNKGCVRNKQNSYLEYCQTNTYEKMINESFCEIGKTFVMPYYQNKEILKV